MQQQNEPLPDPQTMSPNDRIRAINETREGLSQGHNYPPEHLRWLISLIRIERAAASGRPSRTTKPSGPPPTVDEL